MRYEPGIYIGAFQQAGVEIMGEKQTPFMCLTYQITHRVRGTELEPLYDEECATRDVRLCLNDNSIEYTEPKLAAMGFNGNYENPTFSEAIESDSVRLICMENGKYEDWSIAGLMNGQRERKPAPKDLLRFKPLTGYSLLQKRCFSHEMGSGLISNPLRGNQILLGVNTNGTPSF